MYNESLFTFWPITITELKISIGVMMNDFREKDDKSVFNLLTYFDKDN
ncbi:MAG: hypothetical protein ABIN89_00205 [Chitinophagaceae bacterium]